MPKGESITTGGKTGTADGNRDKWFVGYTPYYIGAVWYGYDGRLKTINIPSNDSMNAVRIWHNVMTKIHANLAPAVFYEPPNMIKQEICISSGLLATDQCKAAQYLPLPDGTMPAGPYVITEYFVPGCELNPTTYCTVHSPVIDTSSMDSSEVSSSPSSSTSGSSSSSTGSSSAASSSSSTGSSTSSATVSSSATSSSSSSSADTASAS